jgi:hypothetical protein
LNIDVRTYEDEEAKSVGESTKKDLRLLCVVYEK